jgi:hypothetical protein
MVRKTMVTDCGFEGGVISETEKKRYHCRKSGRIELFHSGAVVEVALNGHES